MDPIADRTSAPLLSESRFLDALLDSVDVGIVACDANGILTLFNRATREFHGLPERAIQAADWAKEYDLYQPDGKTLMEPEQVPLYRALRGEAVRNAEMVIDPKNGPRRTLLASGRAIRDETGKLLGAVVAMHDITDQKHADERIRQSERFLESIVENIPNMIFVKDAKELRFVRFNRAGEKLLGVPRADLIGKNDNDFFPPEQAKAFIQRDRDVLDQGELAEIPEEPISTPTGKRILRTKKIPILGDDGEPQYLLGISEDITNEKQIEEQLRERQIREQFVATLSHDLRSPLSAARTSAELLRRYPDQADARERLTNRIVRSIDRADKMIQNLLDVTLIRAGERLPLDMADCDLASIVSETLDELSIVHGDRFTVTAPARLPGCWNGDGVRRILENLCTNAVKYGDAVAPVEVTISALPDAAGAIIRVRNQGPPIPPEELPYLFQAFRRSRDARLSGNEGWGLGLVLVQGIAEAHGGSIEVASTRDRGTVFEVKLPSARK